jgi:hypothetical protein
MVKKRQYAMIMATKKKKMNVKKEEHNNDEEYDNSRNFTTKFSGYAKTSHSIGRTLGRFW